MEQMRRLFRENKVFIVRIFFIPCSAFALNTKGFEGNKDFFQKFFPVGMQFANINKQTNDITIYGMNSFNIMFGPETKIV